MIVDSSALPEQVVADVLQSAFNSAGQRCSALRVLFVQEEIAPRIVSLLQGAMAELRIGDPALLSTDVGPVIDDNARDALERHAERMTHGGPAALPRRACRRKRNTARSSRPAHSRSTAWIGWTGRCSARSCISSVSPPTAWIR